MKPTTNNLEVWEKQFDKKYQYSQLIYIQDEIKQFISDLRKKDEKELIKNVGMLRQWLNEDRITDVNKLVSSEELLHWLKLK